MPRSDTTKELFTASEVARFCQVDLKTIHNWADRGELQHFRTPGRHLRFRRVDVLDFLRRYGYPVPDVLLAGQPRVLVLGGDEATGERAVAILVDGFQALRIAEPLDALVAAGAEPPDAVVVLPASVPAEAMVKALAAQPSTRHVRVLVVADDESARARALEAGASAYLSTDALPELRPTLSALLGLGR